MTTPTFDDLSPGVIVEGPILPEPVEVVTTVPMGTSIKLIGKGLQTGQLRDPILDTEQLAQLAITPKDLPFDGDPNHFKLGIEAERLGLAYEYDPYFSLSIARVDPLPHQLEAVYEYFLKLPRIRFLLADDPGAGKTIMAGLLLKELKIRGLVKRTLIVAPANLTFQWQREMKDKFREQFDVMRGEILRTQYGQNPWQERNQVVTSVSWISRVEDANESLLRSNWDLVIVDEAHKMSAYNVVNSMHRIVGEQLIDGFPIYKIKKYFERDHFIELTDKHVRETRLRYILLHLVYVQQFGTGPFDVRFKGNSPHIDHIYPQHGLKVHLGLPTSEVNSIGNYRFVGATDNIRKRAEQPASYFQRLKNAGIQIEKHLLLADESANPALLSWDEQIYREFRDRRLDRILNIASGVVNVETTMDNQEN